MPEEISRKRSASHIFLKWLLHLKVVMITYIIYLLVCRIITGNELHLFCQVSKQSECVNFWMLALLICEFRDGTLLFPFPSTHQSTLLRPSINISFTETFLSLMSLEWQQDLIGSIPPSESAFPIFVFLLSSCFLNFRLSKACSFDFRYLLRRSFMEEWHRK